MHEESTDEDGEAKSSYQSEPEAGPLGSQSAGLPLGQPSWAALTLAVPCQGNLSGLAGWLFLRKGLNSVAQAGLGDPRQALKGEAEEKDVEEKKLRHLMLRQPAFLPQFNL